MFEVYYSICLISFKTTYWTLYSEQTWSLAAQDGADIQKDIFKTLQLQRKKRVDKYFALGWHQWLCQELDLVPPWTRTLAVAKDQVLSCLTRNF
jgi:hypothetical protein